MNDHANEALAVAWGQAKSAFQKQMEEVESWEAKHGKKNFRMRTKLLELKARLNEAEKELDEVL